MGMFFPSSLALRMLFGAASSPMALHALSGRCSWLLWSMSLNRFAMPKWPISNGPRNVTVRRRIFRMTPFHHHLAVNWRGLFGKWKTGQNGKWMPLCGSIALAQVSVTLVLSSPIKTTPALPSSFYWLQRDLWLGKWLIREARRQLFWYNNEIMKETGENEIYRV